MSSIQDNLQSSATAADGAKIGIVASNYNADITDALLHSCREELMKAGVKEENLIISRVPGAFELPFGCKRLLDAQKPDAVIALGAIIKGETPHFDFIASAVTNGILELGLASGVPVIFGVLTPNNLEQAKERIAGGKRGDKGVEAAQTAIQMINP